MLLTLVSCQKKIISKTPSKLTLLFKMPKYFRFPAEHNLQKDASSICMSLSEYKESMIRKRGTQIQLQG